ncbi:hypothetical protein K438DRAFT_1815078, partial [Mycena galopus ATCC 62051]
STSIPASRSSGDPCASTTPRPPPPARVLFVGNMHYDIEAADLPEKFTPFGAIQSIRVATRPGGEFLQEENAVAAYESFAVYARPQLARGLSTSQKPVSHGLYFYD